MSVWGFVVNCSEYLMCDCDDSMLVCDCDDSMLVDVKME